MRKSMASKAVAVFLGLMCICLASPKANAAGVPEPGITMYGQVLADDGSLVTQGRLAWTFNRLGDLNPLQVTVTADLYPIQDGSGTTFSYAIHIPAEMVAPGKSISPNYMPETPDPVGYSREATLDGAFTRVAYDWLTTTTFSVAERGKVERVDLMSGVGGPPDVPSQPSPANGETFVPLDALLNWVDTARADSYDIYLWQPLQAKPMAPTAPGLKMSEFQPPLPLRPDAEYLWQVIAKNSKGATAGPVWTFRTAFQGDLQKLLEYLLGKRYLSFQEQLTLDLNADGNLDIADFIKGLKRSSYAGTPPDLSFQNLSGNQDTVEQPPSLLDQRAIALGTAYVEVGKTVPVTLPVNVSPAVDDVAGINLHIQGDPTLTEFIGIRRQRAYYGEYLYSYSPHPGLMNVVFFSNPVGGLRSSALGILSLDLRATLPNERGASTRIRLESAGMSDVNGITIPDVEKGDGYVLSERTWTSSRNWQLYH